MRVGGVCLVARPVLPGKARSGALTGGQGGIARRHVQHYAAGIALSLCVKAPYIPEAELHHRAAALAVAHADGLQKAALDRNALAHVLDDGGIVKFQIQAGACAFFAFFQTGAIAGRRRKIQHDFHGVLAQ